MTDDSDEPLRLPAAPPAPVRPALPIAAAVVPVVGAVVLWQLTGSSFALWFAALGPLMAAASFIDGVRGSRRGRRRAQIEARAALAALAREVDDRHDDERRRGRRRTPDVAGYADDPDEIWRVVPGRDDVIVVGSGVAPSRLRVEGEPHGEDARALRRRARTTEDMPVPVPLCAGVAVIGPPVRAAAVARALLLQVCLAHPPGEVRIVGDAFVPASEPLPLPHAEATRGAVLFAGTADRPIPADVDIPIVQVAEGAPPPPRCAAVLTLEGGDRARLDHDGVSKPVRVEAVSVAQARSVACALAERAATLGQRVHEAVSLDDLPVPEVTSGSLAAAIGISAGEPVVLDLVADGPHAVVVGVTGSGKSELLTTWIVGMCRARSPQQLGLLLVDFKGGRTFDALAALPHVTGVLTDLDEARALRAVESLRAEIRHRERVLAGLGARDVEHAGGALGRLVIVVDECAALVAAHPELHELFADVAARGRALGMHLILASQRVGGAFRDGVLANTPLRIAFRVTDAGDSRALLGSDDAAHLPGTTAARGTALVRRAADTAARTVRVARCDEKSLDVVLTGCAGTEPARRPWLPPLPEALDVDGVRRAVGERRAGGGIVLGLADEPEQQRQSAVVLAQDAAGLAVVGGPGSGRTSLLRTVAAQAARAVWVPSDLEVAWDLVMGLDGAAAGTAVLIDDADAVAARFPSDHAVAWLAALERAAREARAQGITVVMSTTRVSGTLGRVLELLPQRAILPLPARADHVAAGGESVDFVAAAPPGRGRWGRRLVQFAVPTAGAVDAAEPVAAAANGAAPRWCPDPATVRPTAFVLAPGPRMDAVRVACAHAGLRVIEVTDAAASALGSDAGAGIAAGIGIAVGTVIVGSPESWLAQWRVLGDARARGELIVDAGCAAEYRAVTGRRDLPPYAMPGAGRAWACTPDGAVRRVTLPGV